MHEILTPAEMARADQLAAQSGVPSFELMIRAGRAVADLVCRRVGYTASILVLAGPGNNGGDGFVAASALKARGYRVSVLDCSGSTQSARGEKVVEARSAPLAGHERDAARARREALKAGVEVDFYDVERLRDYLVGADIIVDALFGAGLNRPITGEIATLIDRVNNAGKAVVAVDLPSGVCGDSGRVLGVGIHAERTVTFFRKKPAHLLAPGAFMCGIVELVDIGVPEAVLESIRPRAHINGPQLWGRHWPTLKRDGHKFGRGHVVVVSGGALSTGACRLAAQAALRAGAGLVSVATPPSAAVVHAAHLTAVMIRSCKEPSDLGRFLDDDSRLNAVVIGPGAGVVPETAERVKAVLSGDRGCVLDADALTAFEGDPERLFELIGDHGASFGDARIVMTPHEGEFARLFPDLSQSDESSKLERGRRAADRSGAVVVLKGADTVIAAPDGRASVNVGAPRWLATAGSGDVLSGIIGGLLAQKISAFEAAMIGVWLHGEAGREAGAGMISEDLAPALRKVIRKIADYGFEAFGDEDACG